MLVYYRAEYPLSLAELAKALEVEPQELLNFQTENS